MIFITIIYAIPCSYKAQATVVPAETTDLIVSLLLSPFQFSSQSIFYPKPSENFLIYLAVLHTSKLPNWLFKNTQLHLQFTQNRPCNFFLKAFADFLLLNSEISEDLLLRWLGRNTSVTPHPANTSWIIELRNHKPSLGLEILTIKHQTAGRRVSRRNRKHGSMSNLVAGRACHGRTRCSNSWYSLRPSRTSTETCNNISFRYCNHSTICQCSRSENQPNLPNRLFLSAVSLLRLSLISLAA